jgi:hypothetical protein
VVRDANEESLDLAPLLHVERLDLWRELDRIQIQPSHRSGGLLISGRNLNPDAIAKLLQGGEQFPAVLCERVIVDGRMVPSVPCRREVANAFSEAKLRLGIYRDVEVPR